MALTTPRDRFVAWLRWYMRTHPSTVPVRPRPPRQCTRPRRCGRALRQRRSVHGNHSASRFQITRQDLTESCLPLAARPHQSHNLAGADLDGSFLQYPRLFLPIAKGQTLSLKHDSTAPYRHLPHAVQAGCRNIYRPRRNSGRHRAHHPAYYPAKAASHGQG